MDKLPLHEDPAALADVSITHEQIAASAFGVPVEQVTKAQRNWAKTRRWAYIYSTPARTLHQAMSAGKSIPRLPRMDAALATRYLNEFREAYPEIFLSLDKISGKYKECVLPKPQNPIKMPEPGSFGAAAAALHEDFMTNRPKSGKQVVIDSLMQELRDKGKDIHIVTAKAPTYTHTGRLSSSDPDIQNFPGTLAHDLEMMAAAGGFRRGELQLIGGRLAGRRSMLDYMIALPGSTSETRKEGNLTITHGKTRDGMTFGRMSMAAPPRFLKAADGQLYAVTHGGQQIAKKPVGFVPEPTPPFNFRPLYVALIKALARDPR